MLRLTSFLLWMGALSSCATPAIAERAERAETNDSGGPLLPEQAAYDVTFYELDLDVRPDDKAISGSVRVRARVGSPLEWFVLDLDPLFDVESTGLVRDDGSVEPLPSDRRGGRLWIDLGRTFQPGEQLVVEVRYGGQPRVAPKPPWSGGFTWSRTVSGAPWITTTCQGEGADLWWPVKDHVSDEPDAMELRITVPDPLVVASNGKLERVVPTGDGRSTYHWSVSTPINTYCVALNIAPYEVIEDSYVSVTGETFPVMFWVLPEHLERGREFFPEILEQLRFFEETLGPYPFRADKYGVAQTPHLGMEHQTIIAYGAEFRRGAMTGGRDWGFDVLHHHELSHEWWGNLVTNADWSDMWLHEGFGTYMQPLYLEKTQGIARYHEYLRAHRRHLANRGPLAPREARTAEESFNGDVYFKGAWVLHTLRYLVGDETMRQLLRRMAYPDRESERATDGSQCRFASTSDFVSLCAEVTGRDLGWFFEVYARQPALPRLDVSRTADAVVLRWEVPGDLPFPMPVDVRVGDEVRRVELPDGSARVPAPADVEVTIDPDRWLLRDEREL